MSNKGYKSRAEVLTHMIHFN